LGIMLTLISIYGLALYNTWHDPPIFRVIWSLVSLVVIPGAGLLIYYGIGQNL
jgi:hypothetical protein